jgi:hypothetical protein
LGRRKPDFKVWMRSRSVNVMFITFDGFTLLTHFCQLFEALTAAVTWRQATCNSPQNPKLYTKATVKANPAEGQISTASPRRRFHPA